MTTPPKPRYKGEFEMWGTDACSNEDTCGGRITLFVANKKCISCDPSSYEKPAPSPSPSYIEARDAAAHAYLLDDTDLHCNFSFADGYDAGHASAKAESDAKDDDIRSLTFNLEQKSKEIGRAEHRGNTVDFIYDKVALYGKQIEDQRTELTRFLAELASAHTDTFDRIVAALREFDRHCSLETHELVASSKKLAAWLVDNKKRILKGEVE